MTLTPLPKRVLLRPIFERPSATIEAPDASEQTPTKAAVITCGADCHEVKPCDTVEITEYLGMPCELDGVPHLVMKEAEILAIHRKDQRPRAGSSASVTHRHSKLL